MKIMDKFKKLPKIYKFCILLVIILLITFFGVFAKYILSKSGSGKAKVDKVYYSIASDDTQTVIEENTITMYFDINNYDGDNINQVLMKYYLKITGIPVESYDADCSSLSELCDSTGHKDKLEAMCPVTCGVISPNSEGIYFKAQLSYQNDLLEWVVVNFNTIDFDPDSKYFGYYEIEKRLTFENKTTHKYKLKLISNKNILTEQDFSVDIDIKMKQTTN